MNYGWVCIQERHSMLCERTLKLADKTSKDHDRIVVMPNIHEDEWVNGRGTRIIVPPGVRFYAGTAIPSPLGPVIGVKSVMDDISCESLSDGDQGFLQHMADTVMSHLDMVRSKEELLRTSQMVIGLGYFVESRSHTDERLHSKQVGTRGSVEHQDYPPDLPGAAAFRQPGMKYAESTPSQPVCDEATQLPTSSSFEKP